MQIRDILKQAEAAGFQAAIIPMTDVVFDGSFRRYCAENLCGNFGINQTCPPECGSFVSMRDSLQRYADALVLCSYHRVADWRDGNAVLAVKRSHNAAALRLIDALHLQGKYAGASHCVLCETCVKPCPHPEQAYSCLSAYCVNVSELAKRCGMAYSTADGSLGFFSLYAFDGHNCL